MTATHKHCARCGGPTPSIDNTRWSTFWGGIGHSVERIRTHTVRIFALDYRSDTARRLSSDEDRALCSDCWSALVGRFLQGRSVDALPGKEEPRRPLAGTPFTSEGDNA